MIRNVSVVGGKNEGNETVSGFGKVRERHLQMIEEEVVRGKA